jgi:transposase
MGGFRFRRNGCCGRVAAGAVLNSQRQLMEQLNYNLLFRWFVGLNADDALWAVTVFTKIRERMMVKKQD